MTRTTTSAMERRKSRRTVENGFWRNIHGLVLDADIRELAKRVPERKLRELMCTGPILLEDSVSGSCFALKRKRSSNRMDTRAREMPRDGCKNRKEMPG